MGGRLLLYGAVLAIWLAVGRAQTDACAPGYGRDCADGVCVECTMCGAGFYSQGGEVTCSVCPTGTTTTEPGSTVCDCKEGFFFDEQRAASLHPSSPEMWPTLGCTDCTHLFSVADRVEAIECPGGQVASATNYSASQRRSRRLGEDAMYVPQGPLIALSGWYVENKECTTRIDSSSHRCITRHACADGNCMGLPDLVRKEANDMSEVDAATAANDHTQWCKAMHQMALDEGARPEDLRTAIELYGNGTEYDAFFYQEQSTCKERYITVLYDIRKTKGSGVRNYCYPGHDSDSRACAECEPGLEKGDDGLCHNCASHSWWATVQGDVYTIILAQIPYTLFMKSGKPQSLKSAMFASFMFFMQTVSMLGEDSGYFLGNAFDDEDKAVWLNRIDTATRFVSANMATAGGSEVVNETVTAEEVCPIALDRHERFIKAAVLKPVGLLVGVVLWHHLLFLIFVYSRLHYYLFGCFGDTKTHWCTEVKAVWQEASYPNEFKVKANGTPEFSPPAGFKGAIQRFIHFVTCEHYCKPERGKWEMMPFTERAVYGPSAIMLDFHTCGILMNEARAMKAAKNQVARVQARAHFIRADVDKSKTLDHGELKALLQDMGERPTDVDLDEILKDYGTVSNGSKVMKENEFVEWWLARRLAAKQLILYHSHKACSCCDKDDLRDFRPQGTTRAEAVLSCSELHHNEGHNGELVAVHPDLRELMAAAHVVERWRLSCWSRLTFGCKHPSREWIAENYGGDTNKSWLDIKALLAEKEVPTTWFTGDKDDREAFRQRIATVTSVAPERVRINFAYPIAQQEVLVAFDVLPEGYKNDSRIVEMPKHPFHPDNPKKKMPKKAFIRESVNNGLETRDLLDAGFIKTVEIRDGVFATHLDLQLKVDMKNANPHARFYRAIVMLCTTVLFFPVVQDTFPIIYCTSYATNRYWDRTGGEDSTGAWQQADLVDQIDISEMQDHSYLHSDRSVACDGDRHTYFSIVAYIILLCCVALPYVAFRYIRQGKQEAYEMARKAAESTGQVFKKKQKRGFWSQIFLGIRYPPSRREIVLFEAQILRDSLSGLYAMCEPRAYYWFVVDLMRKAITTIIYTFGRNVFDWQFVMMIFFVFVAVMQDIAQPYRGRAENIFSFMTLMFIIVVIYTSNNTDTTSLLPLIIMISVVACTFVVFAVGTVFAKKQERIDAAENNRRVRSARTEWGTLAKRVLLLDPATTSDVELRKAFTFFDDADTENKGKTLRASMRTSSGDPSVADEDAGGIGGDGRLTRGELMAFTDKERLVDPDRRIPKLEDDGHTPCFDVTWDQIDNMIAEADTKGTGDVTYDEFVGTIFNSWDQRQQTDELMEWLYKEYEPVDMSEYKGETEPYQLKLLHALGTGGAFVPLELSGCCKRKKDSKGQFIAIQKRYLYRTGKLSKFESPLVTDFASFCGMLEAISHDPFNLFAKDGSKFEDGSTDADHSYGFKVDLDHLDGLIGLRLREAPLADNKREVAEETLEDFKLRSRETARKNNQHCPTWGPSYSQADKDEAENIFRKLDTHASGKLSKLQVKQMGIDLNQNWSDEKVDEIFELIDSDNSGAIEFNEFLAWWLPHKELRDSLAKRLSVMEELKDERLLPQP